MSDDFMARSIRRRHQQIADDLRQMQADVEHWNRTHPDEVPLTFSADLADEIEARHLAEETLAKETTDGEPQADEQCLCAFAIRQQPGKPTVHDARCERAVSQPETPAAPPTATEEGA